MERRHVSACAYREDLQDDRSFVDVIVPPLGELFSEINGNFVAISLIYGTAYFLLAGDAEARVRVHGEPSLHEPLTTIVKVPNLHTF